MTKNLNAAQVKDLNYQYLPSMTVDDPAAYLTKSGARSARVRRKLDCLVDLSYGNSPGQILDIFPATQKNAPVQVFIHGGYWRAVAVDKLLYSHVAAPLVAAGATVVLLDYDLCPSVRITDIVEQVRSAMI